MSEHYKLCEVDKCANQADFCRTHAVDEIAEARKECERLREALRDASQEMGQAYDAFSMYLDTEPARRVSPTVALDLAHGRDQISQAIKNARAALNGSTKED